MGVRSEYSGYPAWVANVLNERSFRRGPEYHEWAPIRDIHDDTFWRPGYPEWTFIQDIQDIVNGS